MDSRGIRRVVCMVSLTRGQLLTNANRSGLITSACVVHIPCGNFSYTFSVPFFRSFAERGAESANGTI